MSNLKLNKMESNKTITYTISTKSVYGNYGCFVKEFKNDKHFENWYDLMVRKGHKIIGVKPYKETK